LNTLTDDNNILFCSTAAITVKMLGAVIGMLGPDLTGVASALEELGKRHAKYGCVDEDYDLLGDTLMQAMGDLLQEKWSPELAMSWKIVYRFISKTMIAGSQKSRKPTKGTSRLLCCLVSP
jgi:hemoglobin-like flavoprotein